MNICVVTSLYPPHHLGGYELACAEIVGRLADRGHQVRVLTSSYRSPGREAARAPDEDRVTRGLSFLPWLQAQGEQVQVRARREWRDHSTCRRVWRDQRPDVVSVWDLWGLLPGLITTLERLGAPLTYAVSSPWPLDLMGLPDRWAAFWRGEGSHGWKRIAKKTLFAPWRRAVDRWTPTTQAFPDLRQSVFFSRALKQQHANGGYDVDGAPVVYHGIDLSRFPVQRFPSEGPARRLLFAGRLTPEKGVHTVLEALALLRQDEAGRDLTLDVVGPDADPAYARALRQRAAADDLRPAVRFHPQVPRSEMPALYREHDALLFPSEWEEPFALTLLEAMASGIPVVGTMTGGSKEILEDGVTGLVFDKGDAVGLARQVRRMIGDAGLRQAVARAARDRIERDFRIQKTVDQIEGFLERYVQRGQTSEVLKTSEV